MADMKAELEKLKALKKVQYLAEHLGDSDENLIRIAQENQMKLTMMDSRQLVAMADLVAEIESINEILTIRKKDKERLDRTRDFLSTKSNEYVIRNINNLPYAVTANGQLVAAILEDEDGLTEDELYTWCDELEQLERDDFILLLNGLRSEGVIKLSDNVYHLLAICGKNLMADEPCEFACLRIDRSAFDHEEKEVMKQIAGLMLTEGGYLIENDLEKTIERNNYSEFSTLLSKDISDIKTILRKMKAAKIIDVENINDVNVYGFHVLGNKPPQPIDRIEMNNKYSKFQLKNYSEYSNTDDYYKDIIIFTLCILGGSGTMEDMNEYIDEHGSEEPFVSISAFSTYKRSSWARALRLEGKLKRNNDVYEVVF